MHGGPVRTDGEPLEVCVGYLDLSRLPGKAEANPLERLSMHQIRSWLLTTLCMLIMGCGSLPSQEGRIATTALEDTDDTRLGRAIATHVATKPGETAVYPLSEPASAFAARVLLARDAERSLDLQYYIWHGDQTGYLLFDEVWQAAERGVRVRMLLDDNSTAGLDPTIAALDSHPNIEVRLYNPVVHRGFRAINFLTDFSRVNRRMHNKSFTADNQVTIVGGRNVGDEYFGAGSGVVFADLDVMAAGSAVQEVSEAFDLFWNSPSAYPAEGLLDKGGPEAAAALKSKVDEVRADSISLTYLEAVRQSTVVRALHAGRLPFTAGGAQLLHDDPAKTLDTSGRRDVLLLSDLLETVGSPSKSFDLVSPYFVPGDEGTASLVRLASRGVQVRILTNSLAATDVSAVHAGYAKRRKDLLAAGVRLYELKRSALDATPREGSKPPGSSSASLHAKTFALDGRRVFVGSFNFDLRSALLNTELGLLIDSPALAARLAATFDADIPKVAYEVRLATDGESLEWVEQTPSGEKRYNSEPGSGVLLHAWIGLLSILPIEWLL
jgi:putative cardiolipin synthase